MKSKTKALIISLCAVIIIAVVFALLIFKGYIRFNKGSAEKYNVRGVDVSEYQGEIDWNKLAEQNISFAFIRASEGSGYTDKYFSENFKNAAETDICIGAYHFFSFDSPAETQAENFIAALGNGTANMLPPVVDIELYGKHKGSPPEQSAVHAEFNKLLGLLEEHYGVKPIIYTTQKTHALYIGDLYGEYPLWIRDVYFTPNQSKYDWQFWQYSDKGRLGGYSGVEKYIDLNVFRGNLDELKSMLLLNKP